MAWLKVVKSITQSITGFSAVNNALDIDNTHDFVLDEVFQDLQRNGFFEQPPAAWQIQIIHAVQKALPDLSQRPGNDAVNGVAAAIDATTHSQSRKRKEVEKDVQPLEEIPETEQKYFANNS